jgi:hypothetical protein
MTDAIARAGCDPPVSEVTDRQRPREATRLAARHLSAAAASPAHRRNWDTRAQTLNQGVPIHATAALEVPNTRHVQLHDVLTRFLNGSGGIDHVVNDTGVPVNQSQPGPSDDVSYP